MGLYLKALISCLAFYASATMRMASCSI